MEAFFKQLDRRFGLTHKFALVALSFFVPRNGGILITCRGRSDGMAAQACGIYSAMLYARATGNRYCHSPIRVVDHNVNNEDDWARQVEDYFSFALDEEMAPEEMTTFNLDRISSILKFMFLSVFYRLGKHPFLLEKQHYHEYGNRHPDDYADMAGVLRRKFYHRNPRSGSGCNRRRLRVACHIRRGDVNEQGYPERFTSNQCVARRLARVSEVLTELNIPFRITIYSQGELEGFEGLSAYGHIQLHGTAFDDFQDMVEADILMTAKSCFSFAAALMSEGVIVYDPFYHRPLSGWFSGLDLPAGDRQFNAEVIARYTELRAHPHPE